MNLRSCDNCGVVLDADKLIFPDQKHWWREDGTYDESMSAWHPWSMTQLAKIPCPACEIFDPSCDPITKSVTGL
jgi:hypothetical protein